MSRAFIKEDVDLPERSGRKRSASGLPPGATNYITARGAKRLRDQLQKLRAANAVSERVTELEQILASVHVVDPPDAPSNSVTFGATVTVKDKKAAPKPIRCSVLTNSNSSRTPSVEFLRSAKRSWPRTWVTGLRLRMDVPRKSSRSYKIRGRQKRKARTSGPFLRFSESYCFGSGSDAKFAWTNIHLSPFFTKTRVDFARFGVVFPSLSCVRPA